MILDFAEKLARVYDDGSNVTGRQGRYIKLMGCVFCPDH